MDARFYKEFRAGRNMTQEEMAGAAGVSASAISALENGVHRYNHKVDLYIIEVSDDPRETARSMRGDDTDG